MNSRPVFARLRRASCLCFVSLWASLASAATDPVVRTFRVATGDAATTLRQFAAQASEQVVFPAEAVRGVTTHAVNGEFTPREALNRMTAGTTLVVVQDEKTGALSVRQEIAAEKKVEGRPAGERAAAVLTGSESRTAAPVGTGAIEGRVKNAVTGAHLNNARVSVAGTMLLAFTDESGRFRIAGVPAGTLTLEVFYTGLDLQAVVLTVAAGQTAERNVELTSAARYGEEGKVVRLDAYKVGTARETDIEAIAINEQRFSPNIKNVISTETLGDPLGGSMGDFLRFLPGVSASAGALETEGVLIRGFPSSMSIVSLDGVQLAGASAGGGRDFTPSRIGANSISRVEVTKVPLPSTPADTMSGSINMVSKSAFERSRAEFKYRLGLTSDDQRFSLQKTPDPSGKRSFKVYPDFGFDYTRPIGKNLGIVLTGLTSKISHETDTWYTDYLTGGTGTGATPANPYLWRNRNVEVSRNYERDSLSGRVDWRVTPHAVLSAGAMVSYYYAVNWNSQFNPTAGNVGTSSIAGGTPLSFTPETTVGATGRGSVPMAYSFSNSGGLNQSANVKYRLDDGVWRVQSSVSRSNSKAWRRDTDRGFFNSLTVGLKNPVRVTYLDVHDGHIGDFQVFDNTNRAVDVFDINNYNLTAASNTPNTDVRATITNADVDVRRQLGFLAFPAAVQFGGLQRRQTNDDRRLNGRAWTYNGSGGSLAAAPYLSDVYYGERPLASYPSKPDVPWVSPYKVWSALVANPALFTQTLAQQATTKRNNITTSKYIREDVSAVYAQGEMRLFRNRLSLVTGVRMEKTSDLGLGPLQDPNAVFVRNVNGTFAHTPTGAKIRQPEAGAAGSLEEIDLIYRERAASAERSYHGYYPSLHLNFNATDKLLLRAAYAKTYGRPDFANIIPNTTVNQDDTSNPDITTGKISFSNAGLRPWTADNYDLSAEFYTQSGGVVSGGVFLKDIKNFFGNYVKIATAQDLAELGLDPQYVGWQVTTQFNSGSARVRGAEVNVRQSLAPLGGWGRYATVFANATKLRLEGSGYADFTGFLPESVNWGFTLNVRRTIFIAKWNYRGEQKSVAYPDYGPDAFRFPQPRIQLDLSLDYQLSKRTLLYLNVRNATNATQIENARGSQSPRYAQEFNHGVFNRIITVGIKGSF